MSIECLNQALRIEGLTPTKKFILVILANYCDEQGTCYPSYKHLAKMVGLKDSGGVKKAIKEFEQLGLLRIENRLSQNGGYTSNRYYLTLGGSAETPRVIATPRERVPQPSNTKEDTKEYNDAFQEFWKHYPRAVAKKHAYKSFLKFDKKHWSKIVHGAKYFARLNEQTEERFIPHASTWLNQERWLDAFDTDENGCVIGAKDVKNNNLNSIAG